MRLFGNSTLISILSTTIFCLVFTNNDPALYIPVVLISLVLCVLFVPIIRVTHKRIRLYSLNPFATRINTPVADMAGIHIYAGNLRFKINITLNNGQTITSRSMLRYVDMKGLYDALSDTGVPVTSTGVRSVSWKS